MIITKYDDYIIEEFLKEAIMNEEINFNNIKNTIKKIGNKKVAIKKLINKFNGSTNISTKRYLGAFLIILFLSNTTFNVNKVNSSELVGNLEKATTELISIADDKGDIDDNTVDFKDFDFLGDFFPEMNNGVQEYNIISTATPGLIDAVNAVKPGRLDTLKIPQYDKYDEEIFFSLKELEDKGETVDPNLVKTIMMIETGMKPKKNSLGFEGFPQTKEHTLNGWTDKKGKFHPGINQKHGTNFTMSDMYDAGKSAQFIHYYLKSVSNSSHVENTSDMLIAYNWGAGNLGKYKAGKKKLPKQSSDYVKIYKAIKPYYPTI